MIKCLLSRPGLIAGPLHSIPLQIISQSIPRLVPIDSKSSLLNQLQKSDTILSDTKNATTSGIQDVYPGI